jgi:hypothetical protein
MFAADGVKKRLLVGARRVVVVEAERRVERMGDGWRRGSMAGL